LLQENISFLKHILHPERTATSVLSRGEKMWPASPEANILPLLFVVIKKIDRISLESMLLFFSLTIFPQTPSMFLSEHSKKFFIILR